MIDAMKAVIKKEREALDRLNEFVGESHKMALDALLECRGKVVFMGIGKSGHIGQKLAATFSSTGTAAFFVHAAEAVHGDLGMIQKQDIVILISNSGKTQEVIQNIAPLKNIGCKTIAFTCKEDSVLAASCDYKLLYPDCDEADALNLAPTVSSTLALALGDALACALSGKKKFGKNDFYKFHPGGALGDLLKKTQ